MKLVDATSHYGHQLRIHLSVSKGDEHYDEAVALYQRLKRPEQMRAIDKFRKELGLVAEELDVVIEKLDPGIYGVCHTRSDHFFKGISLAAGDWRDDDHPIHTLAHEMLHGFIASHMSGWLSAAVSFEDDKAGDPAVIVGGVARAVAERGEERVVLILTELLWQRLRV